MNRWLLTTLVAVTSTLSIADERPDLSGTYDIATLTPLERPKEYGDNLYLTPERAEQIANEVAAQMAEANLASDPSREAPPEGGDGSTGAAGNVGGYNAFWIDNGDSMNLVDGQFRTSIISQPKNGRLPDMHPEGRQRLMKRFASFERNNQGVAW